MSLVQACLDGLVLYTPNANNPVDFIAPSQDRVFVAYMGWWGIEYARDYGIAVINGTLEELPGSYWRVNRRDNLEMYFGLSEGDAVADGLKSARLLSRYQRSAYMDALAKLKRETLIDFHAGFDAYVQEFSQLPELDPLDEIIKTHTALREIGMLSVEDANGNLVDVLAIDGLGGYATAHEHNWLESIGEQWALLTAEQRPPLDVFLAAAANQNPHDGTSVRIPFVITKQEGSLESVAIQAASQ